VFQNGYQEEKNQKQSSGEAGRVSEKLSELSERHDSKYNEIGEQIF
jgi:hypothetical protein